ncbi:fructosamine kinase family protein [Robiginitalea sp. SC105]|uniref:fructosamine kinase family protein n=1 Tax=Robiginitalea sp. SC105 TaxID=2762332 RepID=UPI00163A4488|nr:fructosamine kinase family protein [Robiginitalea sp. SC105]MBC2838188.1 fructosamine kinase family protein [Robiginitalea sp. SC105]
MAPESLPAALEAALGKRPGSLTRLSGGDIANAYRVEAGSRLYFVKTMEGDAGRRQLETEVEGLRAISRTDTLRTPGIEGVFPLETGACLILEFIASRMGSPSEYRAFGQALARMHGELPGSFGWPEDNFIGSLPQPNDPSGDWPEFYASQRLGPQYRLAVENGMLGPDEIPERQAVLGWLQARAGEVRPSLLHGDLWGGNHLIADDGMAVLIDPAVYRGHAEVDLAMSRLFGGYPPEFYEGYYEVRPPRAGESQRQKAYQLYYLLVHLNLFGRSYASGVRRLGRELFGVGR